MATDAAAPSKKRGRPAPDDAGDRYVQHSEIKPMYLRHYVTGAQYWNMLKGHLKGFVDCPTFERFKSELVTQEAEGASEFVKTTLEEHTVEVESLSENIRELQHQVEVLTRANTNLSRERVILFSKVEALESENANLQTRLKVVEDLASAFEVLYPTKSEVKDMFKDSKK
ncbi:hypothetical protein CYMTET_23203 [Cymbomonas tetramitiformis]|uniref:Uncharacterized protein n=1 Tax=Cymbomonas tetramitiformis TaxID=36881 RepID=A0AAE0FYN1_9CHLO|nr:hypothetical protein CYMTET_23203 [Cymbomonas tetramitiformis]